MEAILPADLRSAVYRTVIYSKTEHSFEALLKLYKLADMHGEKNLIARALGCVTDQALVEEVLQFAMSSEMRAQDTRYVLAALSNSKIGRNVVWSYFQANCSEFRRRYEGNVMFGDMVKSITQNFASEAKAIEIEQFFRTNPIPGTERNVNQAVETIRVSAKWLDRDLEKFLSSY